jgi:DNA replication licensing factor MCM6
MAAQAVIKKHHPEYVALPSGAPREFWIHFYNLASLLRLRELRTGQIGRLVSVCGTVTRTSEVRPELLFGTFVCLDCQTRVPDVEQRFKYTEPLKCANPVCANTNRWQLDVDTSKFVDWQKVRVQENANEIPSGAMPRTLEVILRQDAVEKAKAGDRCTFTGTLIVVPDLSAVRLPGAVQAVREISKNRDVGEGEGIGGLKGLGVRELTYRLAFLASSVAQSFDGTGGVSIQSCSCSFFSSWSVVLFLP